MELAQEKAVEQLISQLRGAPQGVVRAEGTWGSFAHLLSAHVQQQLNRPVLFITPHIDDADKALDDMMTFGAVAPQLLSAWEGEEEIADATDEVRSQRLRVVLKTMQHQPDQITIAPVQALCQPVPLPEVLQRKSLSLQTNTDQPLESLCTWLVDNGFESVEQVDLPGQFARRGGIIDIFAPLIEQQSETDNKTTDNTVIRIEFFGDTIESIREVNLDTMRSTDSIERVKIFSATAGEETNEKEQFLNILPDNTLLIFEEPGSIEEVVRVYLDRVENPERLYDWQNVFESSQRFGKLEIWRFAPAQAVKLNVESIQQYQHKATSLYAGHAEALDELVQQADKGKNVTIYCEAAAEVQRLKEMITNTGRKIPVSMHIVTGFIHHGFALPSQNYIAISHHEIFGQYILRRRQRPTRLGAPVETLGDLETNDYVVHLKYGIGKYLGIETMEDESGKKEYLTLLFADGVKMHVGVDQIHLVQKFIGTSPKRPKLSKIGGKAWSRQKEKAARSVENLAAELLDLQAKRQALGGFAFKPDSKWQVEFEESFPYTETTDQTTAIDQIKTDMLQPTAMDRLLCGDVGYGKTELAMRAAFKAVDSGKQVAMLVPTTVLSVQHGRSFRERFADFPIRIETLNRFKTAKEAKQIVEDAKNGMVDILIGTHRLLSKDIGFKDLGLLIIDEEQRFGVEHKEKLKRLRVNMDILTLTATPIPRTLHMSLLGLRDISSLGTPPLDRRSVVTEIRRYRPELVRKAILREMNRQGQVFFVHNRVQTIEKRTWELMKLFEGEDIRFRIAHGQMSKRELENAMIDFVLGEIDVLVCTTIIESGLDIPNANTIFIDNADRFGLAELHQLRGRVGRYKYRAYAYMLLPANRSITPIAARRLKAIEEYSHLGAGFKIALRDLEIRGAGNILGPEQSGHIQMVGYQLYCDLLSKAVQKLKGETVHETTPINIDLGFATYIPRNLIASDRQRLEAYRRLATAKILKDIKQLEEELRDVYGQLPEEVHTLLSIAAIRIKASDHGITSITTQSSNIILTFKDKLNDKAHTIFAKTKAKVSFPNPRTVYLRYPENYFEPQTLIRVLCKMFKIK